MDAVLHTSNVVTNSFGPLHVIEPKSFHTHTAILLHGRGSTGEEFEEELFESKSLAQKLPGWRWVFPSSRELWSTAFEEEMPAWFEAHSLADITTRQDLQVPGIKESVSYIDAIVDAEIKRLGGKSEKVVLGGISQGGAIGLWAWLCTGNTARRLGAFVGASTWLPFATNIQEFLGLNVAHEKSQNTKRVSSDATGFVESMMGDLKLSLAQPPPSSLLLSTPVFLGHGVDDAYVDIALGQQVRQILTNIGLKVVWKEYSGAEQEGHWLKEPEEVDNIGDFLVSLE